MTATAHLGTTTPTDSPSPQSRANLPALRAENTSADTMRERYGWQFSWNLKDFWTDGADLNWADTITALAQGITVRVRCRSKRHLLHLHTDGSMTLFDHPNEAEPTGRHITGDHIDAELLIAALGGAVDPCLANALWLVGERTYPDRAHALRTRFADTAGARASHDNARVRPFYAAVAWAQHTNPDGSPCWPAGAWSKFLSAGTTPATLECWLNAGWTVHDATAFLNQGAPLYVAEQWRAAGDTTARAALLAGRGETPDADQRWLTAGFTATEATRWRTFKTREGRPLTPTEAWDLHQAGLHPRWVEAVDALPRTQAEANERGYRIPKAVHVDPTRDQAIAWARAGVPCDLILSWFRFHGDNLEAALAWSKTVTVWQYGTVAEWNNTHPDAQLVPDVVRAMARIGVPVDLMGPLIGPGLGPVDILRPLNMLTAGRRWLGREARRVLSDHVDATCADQAAARKDGKPHPLWQRFRAAIDEGDWEVFEAGMRGGVQPFIPLWTPYVEWLCSHPVPPALPARTMT